MSRLPIPHFIQEIKTKLGFDRAMTASGEDVVDAVNKQSQQIGTLETKAGRLGKIGTGTFVEQWTFGMMLLGWGFIIPFVNCNKVTISAVKVLSNNGTWENLVISNQPDQNYYLLGFIPCTVPTGVTLDNGKAYLVSVSGTVS